MSPRDTDDSRVIEARTMESGLAAPDLEVSQTRSLNQKFLRLAYIEADGRTKRDRGHTFLVVLKTRCIYCKRSPKVKTRCGRWFDTFLSHLENVLVERGFVDTKP